MKDYVQMPKSLTAENGAKAALIGEFSEKDWIDCPHCFGDDDSEGCDECGGNGRVIIELPVSWPTIKEIYAKAVKLLAR